MGGPATEGPATEGSAEGTQQFMGDRGGAEGAGHGWLPSLPGLCSQGAWDCAGAWAPRRRHGGAVASAPPILGTQSP